jgi:ATP-dependent protease ClpP protease subunit
MNNRIYFTGEINSQMVMKVLGELYSDTTPVELAIDSTGGDVSAATCMLEGMQNCGREITTIAVGDCMSSAFLIFLAGNRRVAFEWATFMMHEANMGLERSRPTSELLDMSRYVGQIHSLMIKMTCRLSGKPAKWVQTHLVGRGDIYLTAEMLLNMGLADEIKQYVGRGKVRVRNHPA